jgi:hypothetical protein
MNKLRWLFDRATPAFGQISVWLLLLFAIVLAMTPIEFDTGPRSEAPATVFFWLPGTLIGSPEFFTAIRVVLFASAALWALRIWIPISCWVTVVSFTLMWSLRMENLTNGAHIFNVTNMLLVIHAMWFHFYRDEIRTGVRNGTFWTDLNYPRWVFWLSVFYLGWFHSLAGFTKLACCGPTWGNGTSLQLWVNLFGWRASPFAQLILFDSRLTAVLQTGALVIECLSIMAIVHWSARYLVGLGLFGFYLGVLGTFVTFGFHFNAILVALFLLPVDRLIGLKFDRVHLAGDALPPQPAD